MTEVNEAINLEADSSGLEIQTTDIKDISSLLDELLDVRDRIEQTKINLKQLEDSEFELSTKRIPDALEAASNGLMKKIELSDGSSVEVVEDIQSSITKEKEGEAFAWLRTNGHGDLIKNQIKVDFGRGEDNMAGLIREKIDELGLSASEKQAVHPQTLKAFVREQINAGNEIPEDTFSVYRGRKTLIKRKK